MLLDAAGFVLVTRKAVVGLCVISKILLLQSPHICLGLVLFGFFLLLSVLCVRRFLCSEVCASVFSCSQHTRFL